ncbi:chromate efflux transporter (plasmid) [Streptomyces mirabilis]|uniref:chromate efflux transporter n=1 Tax=Streptomyces mirabilis TaxID=68239 RepID=UPI001BB0A8A2|nr:chromate efflux transporter [Streptomyces mirabilis]QUW85609.1 chromate efflux transporter [Streptomyces mirabilis]
MSAGTRPGRDSTGDESSVRGKALGTTTELSAAPQAGFPAVLRYFLRLGTLGFGGPIAVVGYMQRDLVEQRGWLAKQDFLDGVALGQTMPGPLAAQVAMWVGYLRRGALGAAATALAFIAPSFAMVVAVAAVYSHYAGLPVVQSLFYGIAPAVMAIITIAAYKLIKITDGKDWRAWTISATVFTVTAVTGKEPVYLIVAAGLLLILFDARPTSWRRRRRIPPADSTGLKALTVLPVAAAGSLGATASGGTLASLGLFFLKTGALVFGSGLAIVPLLREGVVAQHHWLTQAQFLDAVAIGLITPGPVVITAAFIGYLVAGPVGALVAAVAIFTPIYLGVVVPGRWFTRHRDNRQIKAFVTGATAAAAGALSGAVVVLTRQAVTNLTTAAIALVTLALLWRFKKIPEPYVVVAAGMLGVLLH